MPTHDEPGSVFHEGEARAQERFGLRERIDQIGRHMIRSAMPDEHRDLFEALPTLVVGSLDATGRPWASILFGRPGFARSPDPRKLRVDARPVPGDPLAEHLAVGLPVGLLGIQPETRRRNRLNGRVVDADADGFTVGVEQSFGNCPKYIQAREPHFTAEPTTYRTAEPVQQEGSVFSASAAALARRADTFFIASAAADAATSRHAAHGVDVSHRGGRPGFVSVGEADGHTVLTVPDFQGNYMFNTLGNLIMRPQAGLLFVDFEGGDVLGLTADVQIVWDGPDVDTFPGAERLLRLRVVRGWSVAAALPLGWSVPEPSPHLRRTGAWRA